jgi:hypothetical protein|tara:strand:- start:49 stop:324 length:276 start_codon:yes stop_codon:yes gene_type:complete
MKIRDIINESTSAGGVASVAFPMGTISRRKKPKTLLASADRSSTYRNWDLEKLHAELIKARHQGRGTWQDMQLELLRRAEQGKFGKSGARI